MASPYDGHLCVLQVCFLVVGEVSVHQARVGVGTVELCRINERADYTSLGELAIVSTKKHRASMRRTATLVAEERCLLLAVAASDYPVVLELIPRLRDHVQKLRDLQVCREGA
jgi:hypothetical protein